MITHRIRIHDLGAKARKTCEPHLKIQPIVTNLAQNHSRKLNLGDKHLAETVPCHSEDSHIREHIPEGKRQDCMGGAVGPLK